MVNIKGLNKAQLLSMMSSRTDIVSPWWGLHQEVSEPVIKGYIDYYNGLKIGINFNDDEVSSAVYNRDAGHNILERIVAQLRKEEAEKQVKMAEKNE